MSEKRKIDLQPCPFCGPQIEEECQPLLQETRDHIYDCALGYSIMCPCCGIEMHEEYLSDLLDRWNCGITEASLAALVLLSEVSDIPLDIFPLSEPGDIPANWWNAIQEGARSVNQGFSEDMSIQQREVVTLLRAALLALANEGPE